MEDVLQCDICKKDGSFDDDDLPQLYSMIEWKDGVYCDNHIPKYWEEKLESEVSNA